MRTGVEALLAERARDPYGLQGRALGLVQHPASVTADLRPTVEALLAAGFDVRALFGPQHGARGEKQDNMVESAPFVDRRTGLPVHSLYGEVRKPTADMLRGLDALLFDLQDVGVRVYTFVWTMALAMEACGELGVRFVVLDRPNPIGGVKREGAVLREEMRSFVGLHPVPLRHGLTAGELALWLREERGVRCELEVVPCEGWRRGMLWEETGLPWVLPSPNLPTPGSCAVYPGMVLLEGTNLSEGRGTTRPFELFGAPFLDPWALAERLEGELGPGVRLRPCWFEPTFQKHAGALCGGGQLHVTDARAFEPVRAAVAILRAACDLAPEAFAWREPPYEYEEEKMPIDLLWGSERLRAAIDAGLDAERILAETETERADFERRVGPCLLYAD
ncbi:MAG TPA: DUF1343 domain-containing protein [Longimicrobiales bacterium]|nr:DUF1343 domain-containing protein [Longimicrobiales bacterium]